MKKFITLAFLALASLYVQANPLPFDVVYVRYPYVDSVLVQGQPKVVVKISQGEKFYDIEAGADLMLLKADGSEVVLVDCTTCSVVDPIVSYDAQTVYYTVVEEESTASASWLYKIHLTPPYTPIRLTFNDGFDSLLYAGNTGVDAKSDQSFYRGIRDMSPVPLADGRLLFTSNRAGLSALNPGTNSTNTGSVQQLYVMDDHEGELNTKELANIRPLEHGTLHMGQHPMQLKDGRILFSTWQDVGNKFHYAMTSLFTVYPDGSNLQQFTEPHDRAKHLDHFVTQLPNEDVIAGYYYPSFDFGFGVLHKMPINPSGPDWLQGSVKGSMRSFDRKGTVNITPHTIPNDLPAPNRSGKYAMPAVAGNGNLLVTYSKGYVNYFDSACNTTPYTCEGLRAGIYMIPDAATNIIYDPAELIEIKDDPLYNEIWPRAVLPYQAMMGQATPNIIPNQLDNTKGATALMGTSSMYLRESLPLQNPDEFQGSTSREIVGSNWLKQGSDVGVYTNSDIHAVRILGTPALPYNTPIPRGAYKNSIASFLPDSRDEDVVRKFGGFHGEKWEILGEFPLTHKGTLDPLGNPDTSWIAKVPADTPLLIQTLDINGMTLNSELTWRALKGGESRIDCGGCHIHSGEKLDIATTQAGQGAPILGVSGVLDNDGRIKDGIWNLTTGSIPVMTATGTEFINQRTLGVEFNRDVYPVLQANCASCHNATGDVPDMSGTALEVYTMLHNSTKTEGGTYNLPQVSRYIRNPQARESLLAWVAYGQRLDGRTDGSRTNDLDYPTAHPVLNLADADKRTISRWIDLGGPFNFEGSNGFAYTDDYSLPTISKMYASKPVQFADHYSVGIQDADSGLNWTSLVVSYYNIATPNTVVVIPINQVDKVDEFDTLHIDLNQVALSAGVEYVLKISIEDVTGNLNEFTERLTK